MKQKSYTGQIFWGVWLIMSHINMQTFPEGIIHGISVFLMGVTSLIMFLYFTVKNIMK